MKLDTTTLMAVPEAGPSRRYPAVIFLVVLAVVSCDVAGSSSASPFNLTRSAANDRHPAWRPDGSILAFESDRNGTWDLYLVDRAGANIRPVARSPGHDRYPAWHPDGDRLVFQSSRGDQPELHVVDLRTGRTRQVAAVEGEELFPTWSPDGAWIAFTLVRNERSELWRIREDGSDLEPLVTEPGRHAWPRWSPDGARLAYFSRSNRTGNTDDVFVRKLSIDSARRITAFPGHDFSPAWHPNATRLAAVGVDPDGARRLRILSREGDLLAEMAGGLHRVTEPAWSPDGQTLAYAARRTEADAYDVYLEAAPADPGPAAPLFVPVTEGRIGGDGGASRGVGWADFDSDGDPDLVVSNTNGQWNAFYRNTLDGFRKESDPNVSPFGAVAAAAGSAEGVAWVDVDGDGDLDLHVVTRGREPDLLFENRGEEGLDRITEGPLVGAASRSMGCWADVDGDGWLDVFLVGYGDGGRNALFRNLGDWRFEEVELPPEAVGTGAARACSWGDPDDDGLPDLYVANAREPNVLLRNGGAFQLEPDTGAGHAVEHVGYSYGVSWADFDDDGHQDLFVANFDVENALYRNDGTGRLERVAEGAIATQEGGASKGHAWGDFDLDGRLDLFVANGTYRPDMRNFLYLNRGNGRFERVETGDFAAHADTSAGAAWADMDADGDLDLFIANWGSADQVNRLYRNTTSESTGRSWIGFRLRSDGPNTHAWGAKVRAKAVIRGEPRWMTRWHLPTTGYASQNQLLVHFGLDDAERVDSLVVRWPSGREEVHTDLEARRYWPLREGAAGTGSKASRRTIRRPRAKREPAVRRRAGGFRRSRAPLRSSADAVRRRAGGCSVSDIPRFVGAK